MTYPLYFKKHGLLRTDRRDKGLVAPMLSVALFMVTVFTKSYAQSVPLNDPTKPLNAVVSVAGVKPEQKVILKLNGIFKNRGRYWAMINGKQYRVGDSVGGKTIKRISSNTVYWVEDDSFLQLYPNVVKRMVSEE